MSNSIGKSVVLTLFGESHGPYIGVVIDGFAAGLKVDDEFIKAQLAKRRPTLAIETSRVEKDHYEIISGVMNGYTTGMPICIIIPNENTRSSDYEKNYGIARPSHADYVAHMKYNGFEDYRGGGHFSGRLTAGIVAAGAICLDALKKKNILIGTHILRCGKVHDSDFQNPEEEINLINNKDFPVISNCDKEMADEIFKVKMDNDSIGGVIQTAICNLPVGLGEPWFDSFEGIISNALFSIGGIKGVEFGAGFGFADLTGSTANDAFTYKMGKVVTKTNNSGGINGGITNGMPVIFNAAVKPTPSISKPQETVDFINGNNTTLEITGRHDPAIIRRICIVVTSLVAVVVCDVLTSTYGKDYFK